VFLDGGGEPARLSASSDAAITSPGTLLDQIRSCVLERDFAMELVLPLVTSTPARVLRLEGKGVLRPGSDGDLLVFRKNSLELTTVISRGEVLMRDGRLQRREAFLDGSNRRIALNGEASESSQF
jgi:beta-aspartyl-dipeptidase (metallo-type)